MGIGSLTTSSGRGDGVMILSLNKLNHSHNDGSLQMLLNYTVIVPALQEAWYHGVTDSIARMNWNNRGAESGERHD